MTRLHGNTRHTHPARVSHNRPITIQPTFYQNLPLKRRQLSTMPKTERAGKRHSPKTTEQIKRATVFFFRPDVKSDIFIHTAVRKRWTKNRRPNYVLLITRRLVSAPSQYHGDKIQCGYIYIDIDRQRKSRNKHTNCEKKKEKFCSVHNNSNVGTDRLRTRFHK